MHASKHWNVFPHHTMDQNTHPSGYQHLSDVDIAKCLSLAKMHSPQEEIARDLHCSQSTVNRLLHQYKFETFVQCIPCPPHARKTSVEQDKLLINLVEQHYDFPFHNITNISGLPISSKTTIRRC